MARPHIGLPKLSGSLERYAGRYDLLEVRCDEPTLPKPSAMRAWRKKVPPAFVFSVVLPKVVCELRPVPEFDAEVERAVAIARSTEARCIVIATPASVTPTEANRKRLESLVARLPHDAVTLVWEPRGIWEIEEAARLARKLGVVVLVDPVREAAPAGPIAYFRIRGLGETARLSPAAIDKIAVAMSGRREAFVVVESASPTLVAGALKKRLAERAAGGRNLGRVIKPRPMLLAEDEEQ